MAELSQNAILRISDEKTLELIELYRQEACLWDTRAPHYKNREQRARAAARVARKLDVEHFEARHVLMKFKNLRNSYSQELKKIAKSVEAGEEVYKPTVIWFTKMDSFLRPHLLTARGSHKQSRAVQNMGQEDLNIKVEPESYFLEVADCNFVRNQAEPEHFLSSAYSCDTYKDQQIHVDKSDSEDYICKPRNNTSRKRRYSSHNSFNCVREDSRNQDVQLSQTLNQISRYLQTATSGPEDHYDSFGKYVAALLRSLSPQVAMDLQPKIINLFVGAGVGRGGSNCSSGREVGSGS